MMLETKRADAAAVVSQPDAQTMTGSSRRQLGAWAGLLWCEWFAHSRLLLSFLLGWLACVWLLPFLTHSGWILLVGVSTP